MKQYSLKKRASEYFRETGKFIFSDDLTREKKEGARYVGKTGDWEWLTAFAPEGHFELWAILPGHFSLARLPDAKWESLAIGLLNAQRFYRNVC